MKEEKLIGNGIKISKSGSTKVTIIEEPIVEEYKTSDISTVVNKVQHKSESIEVINEPKTSLIKQKE